MLRHKGLWYQEFFGAPSACLLSHAWFFVTLLTVAHQAPVHGIFQARTLEWVAISFSRTSFELKDRTRVSHLLALAGRFRYHWATWEARNTTKQFQLCSLSCWLNCEPAALNGKLSFPLSSYHSWQRFWLYLQDTTLYPYDLKKWTGKHPCGANGRRTRWSCKETIYNDPSMTHSLHSPRP